MKILSAGSVIFPCALAAAASAQHKTQTPRPNVLFVISDDQSYPYASAYGNTTARTPAFDRIAREGVLFHAAFVTSPGSSPSRASILTGRYPWQIGEAGTHGSGFPTTYPTLPDILEDTGYWVGYTGKGWGPGNWEAGGRTCNPAGPAFLDKTLTPPHNFISPCDYAANFADFMAQRPAGKPFWFWMGTHEPHRNYDQGVGLATGRRLDEAFVPPFLPDTPEIRSDLLDYAVEIEWFDAHLMRTLQLLERLGELDNTLVIVTADNGMSFPAAKANCFEYGFHVPLAVRWGDRVPAGRQNHDLINVPDVMPTILDACGVAAPADAPPVSARSFLNILLSNRDGKTDPSRQAVFAGRERHSSSRHDNLGYPIRVMRTERFLYVRNFAPERWPAGDPVRIEPDGTLSAYGVFHDIDAAPSLDYLVAHRNEPSVAPFYRRAVEKRPPEELFDIRLDPGCMTDLSGREEYAHTLASMRDALVRKLIETDDLRVTDPAEAEKTFEAYERYGKMRIFPRPE